MKDPPLEWPEQGLRQCDFACFLSQEHARPSNGLNRDCDKAIFIAVQARAPSRPSNGLNRDCDGGGLRVCGQGGEARPSNGLNRDCDRTGRYPKLST